MLVGAEMLQLRETSAEIGGAIDLLIRENEKVSADEEEQIEPVLLLGARANSAPPLSNACCELASLYPSVSPQQLSCFAFAKPSERRLLLRARTRCQC